MISCNVLFLYFIISLVPNIPSSLSHEQRNNSCPETQENALNVHFIPHTHDDVGWLKTVDQYYYGTKNNFKIEGVQYILDSVIKALSQDESRKFIFVEMAFFWRWWKEQDDLMKKRVRELVRERRLEFINGGWSMNDEAAAYYSAIIDQMTLGLRFLNDTFGPDIKPKVAWQIDPFGHSKEQANLFHLMGFEGLYFARADHADVSKRKTNKELEMIWESRPNASHIFTGILPHHYTPPLGFCFDYLCYDDPIQSNPKRSDYNLPEKMRDFVREALRESKFYQTNHVPMTMGGDFQYIDASMWFKNMDIILNYFKNMTSINVVYSTPSCYLEAVRQNKDVQYPIKKDDFFPYAMERKSGYWTGYFTSRPSLKRLIRFSNNVLQAVKQLDVLSGQKSQKVITMKRAVAVAQHHDAVTGTAKQHVTDDYLSRLSIGMKDCFDVMKESYKKLLGSPTQTFCPLLNMTQCRFTSELVTDFYVTLYNPLSHSRSYTMRFPGNQDLSYDVIGARDVAVFPLPKNMLHIPERISFGKKESVVYFDAVLPPMSSKTYKVNVRKAGKKIQMSEKPHRLTKVNSDGNLIGIQTPFGEFSLRVEMGYYRSHHQSGAYVFRPLHSTPELFEMTDKPIIRKSGHITEVILNFAHWASATLIANDNQDYVEVDWQVGPIPINGGGKEVIIRYFCSELSGSNSTFYTDSNGRQLMKRVLDERETWDLDLSIDSVSRNYYPVTSLINVRNGSIALNVLTDRSQGGSSLHSGEIELMLHRRLLMDDGFGVGEALNEEIYNKGLVARGHHILVFEEVKSRRQSRNLGLMINNDVIPSFSLKKPSMNPKSPIVPEILPQNVHILTLESVSHGVLIRFEHFFDIKEDPEYSKAVEFNIKDLFHADYLVVRSIKEVVLSGDKYLNTKEKKDGDAYIIKLSPMEIRSFLIN